MAKKQKLVSAATVAELIRRGLSVAKASDSSVYVTIENVRMNYTAKHKQSNKLNLGCKGTDEVIANEVEVKTLSIDNYLNSENLLDVTIRFVNCTLRDLVICMPYRPQNKADYSNARTINFKFHDCDIDNFKIIAYSERHKTYRFSNCTVRNVDFNAVEDSHTVDISVVSDERKNKTFTRCVFSGRRIYLPVDDVTYDTCRFTGVNFALGANTPKPTTVFKNCYMGSTCIGYHQTCPETGSYIGYKKVLVQTKTGNGKLTLNHGKVVRTRFAIAMIEIPADAKRSSSTGRKCRASKAKVLSITSMDGKQKYKVAYSVHNCGELVYRVGETVVPDAFDDNRWNECAPGIHHFITRLEAEQY